MANEATPDVPMEHEPKTEVAEEEDPENGGSKLSGEEDEEPEEDGEKIAIEDEEPEEDGEKIAIEDEKTVEEEGPESSGDGVAKMDEDGKETDGATIVPTDDEGGKERDRATIGPKTFESSVEIFDYFHKLLHTWPTNLNLNKYEHIMLLELLKKGHVEADRKIGKGVKAFQVRHHPQFKSRCFFLTREDESVDDFSFRKCVDHILPLPENMQIKHDVNKALRGRGRGRGRGGK